MSGIDWSKARKGFDFHFKGKAGADTGDFYFISSLDDRFVSETGNYILFRDMKDLPELFEISMRPDDSTWNGEGLPPVGTVCERNIAHSAWCKTKILAVTPEGGNVAYQDMAGQLGWSGCASSFRPIRTPAQLAAEEREEAIKQFMQIGDIYWDTASALYDAGARLPSGGAKT